MSTTCNFPDPNALLDAVAKHLGVTTDAGLSRALAIGAPAISRMRNRMRPLSDAVLISMHEETGWSIKDLKSYLAKQQQSRAS